MRKTTMKSPTLLQDRAQWDLPVTQKTQQQTAWTTLTCPLRNQCEKPLENTYGAITERTVKLYFTAQLKPMLIRTEHFYECLIYPEADEYFAKLTMSLEEEENDVYMSVERYAVPINWELTPAAPNTSYKGNTALRRTTRVSRNKRSPVTTRSRSRL